MASNKTLNKVTGGEPVAILGAIATIAVFILVHFGVVTDVSTVKSLLISIWPLVAAIIARAHVSPV